MKGIIGAMGNGSKPTERAAMLGIMPSKMASAGPTVKTAKIKMAFTKGPVIHCEWMKAGIVNDKRKSIVKIKAFFAFKVVVFVLVDCIKKWGRV